MRQLPASVRARIPPDALEIYRQTFNNAWHTYADPRKRCGGSRRETARRVALAAVGSLCRRDGGELRPGRRSA